MITIVIPVHNRAKIVESTLKSIAAQTLQPSKVVLVDNNSTDRTPEVLQHWAQTHPRTIVLSEKKPGAAAARNRGLQETETPYVMFFDSDDIMPPRHVEEVTEELLRLNSPEIGYFPAVIQQFDGTLALKRARGGDLLFSHIFSAILSTQRMVVATSLIRQAGGWAEDLPAWNDYELGVRLLMAAQRVERLEISDPVKVILQKVSITGVTFSEKAGLWERSLNRVQRTLKQNGMDNYANLIDYRRAILAGTYLREHNHTAATALTAQITYRRLLMKLVATYVAHGGRGVHYLAKLLW